MRNLKKLFAVIVTIAMIATFAIPAFAAAPADVKGTDYEGAVTRLVALGVITGYPDGTFGPKDSITRAQFAAVVVRALGYEEVATASKGTTKFSDVAANHWASGYINLAVSLGIIKGNPNGTFTPDTPVLYEQAVTMVVRALGQDYLAEHKGGYPSGYMVQAKLIGFTDDVKGLSGTAATRGIVAQLIDNAKDDPIYEQTGFGDSPEYSASDETFLSRLGMELKAVNDEVIVTGTPGQTGLDENTIAVGSRELTVIPGMFDIESVFGKKVDLWTNDDGDVVLADSITGTTVAVEEVTDVVYKKDTTTVTVNLVDGTDDKEYTFDNDSGIGALENLKTADAEDVLDNALKYDVDMSKITFTVDDDGNLFFVNAVKFDASKKLDADPVENTTAKSIKIFGSYYIKYDDESAARTVIEKNGEIVDWTALKADDVIFYIAGQGDKDEMDSNYVYIKATNKTVAGTLEGAKPNTTAATSLKVEGTWYDVSIAKTSLPVGSDVGEEVKLTLDPAGKVYEYDDSVDSSNDKYGVVLGNEISSALGDTDYKVKLLTAAGDEIIYTVADEDETASFRGQFGTINAQNSLKGQLVAFHIGSDGEIDSISNNNSNVANGPFTNKTFDTSRKTFNNIGLTDDAVIFEGNNADGYSAIALTDIEDDSAATAVRYFKDGSDIDAILLSAYDSTTSDASYALVTDCSEIADDEFSIDMITTAGDKSISTSNGVYKAAGDVVTYTLDGDGKINAIHTLTEGYVLDDDSNLTVHIVTGTIVDASSSRIKIDDADADSDADYTFWFDADTSVVGYDEDDTGNGPDHDTFEALTPADVYEDMVVTAYVDSDNNVLVLVVSEM